MIISCERFSMLVCISPPPSFKCSLLLFQQITCIVFCSEPATGESEGIPVYQETLERVVLEEMWFNESGADLVYTDMQPVEPQPIVEGAVID